MNKTLVAVALVGLMGLAGCSSTPKTSDAFTPAEDTKTAVKDTRISTDFRDQGIRVHYTLMGKLEKIEIYGVAPAWKGNYDVLAEMDAKDKLIKFVHGEQVTSDRRTKMMAKTLDRARDNTANRVANNQQNLEFDSRELAEGIDAAEPATATDDNVSRRTAERLERAMLETAQSITSSGRLTGVHKTGDRISRDGRWYIARYEWSEKNQAVSETMRNRMR